MFVFLVPVSFVPEWDGKPPLCLPAPPEVSVVNGRKVLMLESFSEVSTRRRGVSSDRKPTAGAVWKQLYSTEPSKGDGDDLLGDFACTHTHTGLHLLKSAAEGKGDPSVKHQSTSVHRRSKFNALLFFHLLPTARRELLKPWRDGMALLFGAAKFVYTYSTIHQSMLWCSEDVTDMHIRGSHGTQPSMSSAHDLLNMQLISHDEISSSLNSVLIFAALM